LAVKPQVLDVVLEDVVDHLKPNALIISVVAGATINCKKYAEPIDISRRVKLTFLMIVMQELLGEDARIIRTMPNTPAMIGEGVTVWSQSSSVSETQHQLVSNLSAYCFL
jgi:pyrroline-5-carboxylate reductase